MIHPHRIRRMPRVHKRVFLFEPCLAAAPLPCTVLSGRILPRLAIGTCDKVVPLPRVFDAHTGVLFSSNEARNYGEHFAGVQILSD